MGNITLGLDIGPTSIGWALVDEDGKRIIASGVRVFPEGVDRDQQGGEQSKTQARRTARGMRRQIARRSRRKRELRRVLIEAGLLPSDDAALHALMETNPYPLRAKALREKMTPHEIGRVLVHLNQRRGFLSNRKTDKAKANDTKGMLGEISELAKKIEASGCQTLGEYLSRLDSAYAHKETSDADRVRRRHTRREMYVAEFLALWDAQRVHHTALLTDALKALLYNPVADSDWVCMGLIFGQRRIYYPASVVGRCEYEPRKKRCPKADRAAQRFRILQEVNNLKALDRETGEERPLSAQERTIVVAYLAEAKERSFDQIRKKLKFREHVRFNLEGEERSKLKGNETDAALGGKKALGDRWDALDESAKNAVVGILIDDSLSDEEAIARLTADHALTREEAETALGAHLPDGYASLCRDAIVRLLPHLERGLPLMGDDASNSALHAAGYLRPDEREVKTTDLLPPAPDLPNPIVRQALVEVRKVVNGIIRTYGRPATIRVELAREAKMSFEQRKEMRFDNAKRRRARETAAAKIEEHGKQPTEGLKTRMILCEEQGWKCVYSGRPISMAQLLAGEVDEDHILPRWKSLDDSKMNRVVCFRQENAAKGDRTPREWLEQSDPQKYAQVLQRAGKLPYPKLRRFQQKDIVLDDFVARQLTDTAYITRLVSQHLKQLGARVETPRGGMTAELRHKWGLNGVLGVEGVKNREDHRHHAVDALVIALIDKKRLHALANARGRDIPAPWESLRADAEASINAINVSHRSRRRISGALHEDTLYGATQKRGERAFGPHKGKPVDAPGSVQRRHAKGWTEDVGAYVRRKPIVSLTKLGHIEKVRDPTIRRILLDHLQKQEVDVTKSDAKIPTEAFKGDKTPRMPTKEERKAKRSPPYSGVPIKSVRMIEESKTIQQVSKERPQTEPGTQRPPKTGRPYHFVKPGNNHHIVYFATGEGEKERWTAEVVTMWEATKRAKEGARIALLVKDRKLPEGTPIPSVVQGTKPNARFVLSLAIGEAFEAEWKGQRRVCIVRQVDQRSRRVLFKFHTDARQAAEIDRENQYLSEDKMREAKAKKVLIDPLGRIRDAND